MITDLGDRVTDAQGLAGYREDGGES